MKINKDIEQMITTGRKLSELDNDDLIHLYESEDLTAGFFIAVENEIVMRLKPTVVFGPNGIKFK